MALVEFELRSGGKVLVNPDHVIEARQLADDAQAVVIMLIDKHWPEVRGTWDEVIERLGRATDVYIMEREEATA